MTLAAENLAFVALTGGGPGGIVSLTTPVVVTSSTTETKLLQAVLAANLLTVGMTFRVQAYGVAGTTTSAPTMTWRVRIGPTTLTGTIALSIAPTPATSQTNKPWTLDALITVRSIGASGTHIGNGRLWSELSTTLAQANKGSATVAAVAVNTTIQNLLELTFQFGTSNAANTLTVHNATIEIVKA